MDLDAVHIDRVLIERTAAHVVLATQFIGLTDAGEGDEQTLDRAARGIRHKTCGGCIDIIHRALGVFETTHLNLREQLFVREQLDVDIDHLAHVEDTLLHGGITDHGEIQYHRIRFVE